MLILFAENLYPETGKISFRKDKNNMKLLQDDWLNLILMGTKIGYAHIFMDKSQYEGKDAIRIRFEMSLRVKRAGFGIELSRVKIAYFDLNLSPLYFVTNSNETGEDKKIEGKVENNVVTIRTTLSGQTIQVQKNIPEGVVFEEMLSYIALQRNLKVGDEWTVDVFNLELLEIVKTHIKVVGKDNIGYKGFQIPVYILSYTLDLMGGLTTSEWISDDGTTYKMETDMMGMKMELIKTDMTEALGEVGEVDIIIGTKIFLGGGVGFVSYWGTQHNPGVDRTDKGIPKYPSGTIAVVGDLKQMSAEFLIGTSMIGYGVTLSVGIGVPIPVLNEDIFKSLIITNKDIFAQVVDYSSDYPQRISRSLAEVSYEDLFLGQINLNGKIIPTGSLSSMRKAKKIANVLKNWILKGDFLLTEKVADFPGSKSGYKVKPCNERL